ncbi:type I-E CRISPR-associated protein Cse1/CasA [Streptomyces californicus]|uniref:type I-E CRISPR-associated protein Cse1/CasA n=1 Tax=Streptomyces californicus TaxID=67351 RepID=UPI0036B6038C
MPSPFTVAEDPWIPVRIRTDLTADEHAELQRLLPEAKAGRHLVGLRTLFSAAHLIADLDLDYPPVESVLRCMLAAGTARVTGLDTGTADGWLDTRDDVLTAGRFSSQAVNAYFDEHAPWETDTLPDPLHPPAPAGLISLLTSRTAHATLPTPRRDGRQVTGCRVVWGTATDLPTAIDPYVVDRDKGSPLRADCTRAVFRDLDALLLKHRPGSKIAVRRPTVFGSIADLPPRILTILGIRAPGWHQDKQDKNFGWYAATTPPVCHYLEERDPDGAAALATLRAHTEATASDLYKALATAWYALNPRRKEDERAAFTTPAITRFYALAEPEFWKIAENPAQRPTYKRTAISVFDTATATMATTVRTMDAVAKARAKLTNPSKRR